MSESTILASYALAQARYAELGVDTDAAIEQLKNVSISLQCWQGDDVAGFEHAEASLAGSGLQVTGNYPGRARNTAELRMDAEQAFALLPGRHRFNLHAMYGEFGPRRVERDAIAFEHFKDWSAWANAKQLQLDFNATCFAHPKAESGFTLSHRDPAIRAFWSEHVQRCREISAALGREQSSPCLHNLWIPDGMKDLPAERFSPRERLREALDKIFATSHDPRAMQDALESKLFGLGSEAFVVGSHEFYLGYCLTRGKMICFDMGHYHPTESVADKISAVLQFAPELLLHVSRGVRWDSDHVAILNDELRGLAEEIVRSNALARVHLALDFFDASISRVAAWVLGGRATLKALLLALLEPRALLSQYEAEGDFSSRLALLEESKTLPFGAVWDFYCLQMGVAVGMAWREEVRKYDERVTSRRG